MTTETAWKILKEPMTLEQMIELSDASSELKAHYKHELTVEDIDHRVSLFLNLKFVFKRNAYDILVEKGVIDSTRYFNPTIADYYDEHPEYCRKFDFAYKDGKNFRFMGSWSLGDDQFELLY